tara:strand:- start:3151 stop:4032 length:882 start_codon:yes stop_codon:yes gene_type:complete
MKISVVIRTLNEEAYLNELLESIKGQNKDNFSIECIIIDSGSSDRTIEIARSHGSLITYIKKEEFTFGKSLNLGTEFSSGNIISYISGHCIPTSKEWLNSLTKPIRDGISGYSYGRQVGRDTTKFSEEQIFQKYYPDFSKIPQDDFFCNNANSAIERNIWEKYKFDENLTGLEDLHLAKRYFNDGGKISYVSDAEVFHIHNEKWKQTRNRYEREALALQEIMPEVQVSFIDTVRYLLAAVLGDFSKAISKGKFRKEFFNILSFRFAQYWGTYRGNHELRLLSKEKKESYFYPN